MRIAIIGYSGSGKSTTARIISKCAHLPTLHLDSVHFAPGWSERSDEECRAILSEFMKQDHWVIDGNYVKLCHEERLQLADTILFFDFNRFTCFVRAHKRYRKFKGQTRPDLGEGCPEKMDWEFIRWLLWDGRKKERRHRFKHIVERYKNKVIVLKNQKQLDAFLATMVDQSLLPKQ